MAEERRQDKTAEAVAHLQAAALELVAAARAALDVVEEAVSDPQRLAPLVTMIAEIARVAGAAWPEGPAGPPPDAGDDGTPSAGGTGVERIRVS